MKIVRNRRERGVKIILVLCGNHEWQKPDFVKERMSPEAEARLLCSYCLESLNCGLRKEIRQGTGPVA